MKRRATPLLLALLSIHILAGAAHSGAKIVFQTEKIDKGAVMAGKEVTAIFHFTNQGDSDLVIEKVRSSCGCTGTILKSRTIPPKGKGSIRAVFDSRGQRAGTKRSTIYVHSNDPDRPLVKLVLRAHVVRELNVDKPLLVKKLSRFQDLVTFPIKISNSSKTSVNITAIEAKGSGVTATMDPQEISIPPGGKIPFRITLKLEKDLQRYIYAGLIELKTDHAMEKVLRLRYFVQVGEISDK